MKIMVLADEESKALWDYFDQSRLEGIDLIISCGDLNAHYLSFLATFTKAPVIYVHGNHDVRYDEDGPDGCECIDDRIFVYRGVRFLGLGGSMRYKPGKYQYTEKEMRKRVRKVWPQIVLNRGFDVLVAHSPARQVNDGDDLPHMGFSCFCDLLKHYKPQLFLHGHVHATYGGRYKREDIYEGVRVINGYERYIFEIPDGNAKGAFPLYARYKKWRWEHFRR
jgi:predicted phosphodiesterase